MKLTKKQKSSIQALNKLNYQVGDKVIGSYGEIFRVAELKEEGYVLFYENEDSQYSVASYDKHYPKLTKPIKEYEKQLVDYVINGLPDESTPSDCKAVISTNKQQAEDALQQANQRKNEIAVLETMLACKTRKLRSMVLDLEKQVKHIMKVVGIIELYLGISEEVIQIQEGLNASDATPLSLRQLVLHMDEETAITGEEGFDYDDLDKFDAWIRVNYNNVLPEKKSIIVFRPRRNRKHYSDKELVNECRNEGNFSTYILIRNGQNLYRIATKHNIYPFLFPSVAEMDKLSKQVDIHDCSYDEEDLHKEQMKYKRNVLVLQGLVDRTEIFNLPKKLSLLKPETYANSVQFIYDGTNQLDEGTEDFFSWLERTNQTVKRGSRIYFRGFDYTYSKDYRLAQVGFESWQTDNTYWDKPLEGIYNIKRVDYDPKGGFGKYREDKRIVFLYKPNDTIYESRYSYESHKRKRANTYYLYYSDDCFINYDEMSLEQINKYLSSRASKRYYLKILPLLRGLKANLEAERKLENDFRAYVRSLYEDLSGGFKIEILDEAIKWWKYKVIEKRPLMKDDAKALRMICKRYEKLVKAT